MRASAGSWLTKAATKAVEEIIKTKTPNAWENALLEASPPDRAVYLNRKPVWWMRRDRWVWEVEFKKKFGEEALIETLEKHLKE